MKATAMIPTYNEALNIEPLLREILRQGPDIGAVVVDDNSPDDTIPGVRALQPVFPGIRLVVLQMWGRRIQKVKVIVPRPESPGPGSGSGEGAGRSPLPCWPRDGDPTSRP